MEGNNYWFNMKGAIPKSHIGEDVIVPGHSIDPEKDPIKDVRQEPYSLPPSFEWYSLNIDDPNDIQELYQFLKENYVEDDDNMFRYNCRPSYLQWALKPPGWKREWHLCIRTRDKKMVSFIAAIPATIILYEIEHKMVLINFLCVYRHQSVYPLTAILSKEITRRVNMHGVFQGVYTVGASIPNPVVSCKYWHRALNEDKLLDVGYLYRKRGISKLPTTTTPGLRQLSREDCPSACKLINNYLSTYKLRMLFSLEEFEHWFTPQKDVIETYVLVSETNEVTDIISFFSLPSSILKSPNYDNLFAAYSWYNVATTLDITELMQDSLIIAKKLGYDVFTCLGTQNNHSFFKRLKFGEGDSKLQFFLYNWLAPPMEPHELGLVLH